VWLGVGKRKSRSGLKIQQLFFETLNHAALRRSNNGHIPDALAGSVKLKY